MPHIHEKIDFTATAYIVFKNKVLLRVHDKYKIWLGVGGHIELDEDPNQAAVREAKEEVGLDITIIPEESLPEEKAEEQKLTQELEKSDKYVSLIPPRFLNIHSVSETHKHIDMVYFARSKTDKIEQLSEHEISDECKWFSAEELEDPKYQLEKIVAFYAKKALKALKE